MVLDGSEVVVSHDAIIPSVSVLQQGNMEIRAMVRETGPPQAFCVCTQLVSHVELFATPWTIACQAPLSIKFSRQGCWSGLSFPSPGDLPQRVNPGLLHWQVDSLPLSHLRSSPSLLAYTNTEQLIE